MPNITYTASNYKFTDPIRYFKANDPIYYEVENIPLKQLHENDLWLKDQLNKKVIIQDIGRDAFSELKPYCNGDDNIVRVKPGRFTARINDAHNIEPLQVIQNLTGANLGEFNTWQARALNDTLIKSTIDKFKDEVVVQALNMNGITDRVFTYPAIDPDNASPYVSGLTLNQNNGSITVATLTESDKPAYPMTEAQLWNGWTQAGGSRYILRQYNKDQAAIGFASLGVAESAFVKRWRGVARTSVVDLPTEATIEIPAFDPNDFYYYNQAGDKVLLQSANQRIDLLFIYAKPVDASSTTIAKFGSLGTPTKITRPVLGLIRGAGLGVNYGVYTSERLETVPLTDSRGNTMILANIGDATSPNTGFQVSADDGTVLNIKGSFPSPDDLMNLAPMLSEQVSPDHLYLIGQSILPLAYIVVTKDTNINNFGLQTVKSENIIDIRPFFRTTELTYNERAGIAAAIPAPSIANPIVTQSELDYEVKRVYQDLNSRILSLENTGESNSNNMAANSLGGRVLAAGYVRGGYNYGVEGVLCDYIAKKETGAGSPTDKQTLKNRVITRYGLPQGTVIDDLPDWDIAKWCTVSNGITNPGEALNDYINQGLASNGGVYSRSTNNTLFQTVLAGITNDSTYGSVDFGSFATTPLTNDVGTTTRLSGFTANINGNQNATFTNLLFLKKKIRLNRDSVGWMKDYQVQTQFWNCIPFSQSTNYSTTYGNNQTGSCQIWIDKFYDYFNIYISWSAPAFAGYNVVVGNSTPTTEQRSIKNNRDLPYFSSWPVINEDIYRSDPTNRLYTGQSGLGVAIYPTITFQVIGIPDSKFVNSMHQTNPLLVLG